MLHCYFELWKLGKDPIEGIKTFRCFLKPSRYLPALFLCPPSFTTLLILYTFHSSQPLPPITTPCCEFWHLSDVCLSFLSQDLGSHGQPINHRAALSPAQPGQSPVIVFETNATCPSVNELNACTHIWTRRCFGAFGRRYCPPDAVQDANLVQRRVHSYLPFPMLLAQEVVFHMLWGSKWM